MIAISGSQTILAEKLFSLLDQEYETLCAEDICHIGSLSPDVLIHCAEYGDIDAAEFIRDQAYYCNAIAMKEISEICLKESIQLVYISTSYVFDGSADIPYRENDSPAPVSVYGDSKLLGEKIIADSGCSFLNVRFSDLYGNDFGLPFDCIDRIKKGQSYKVIGNQSVSPVYVFDAASAIIDLIKKNACGNYHFSQQSYTKAGDFFRTVLHYYNEVSGENLPEQIEEVSFEDYLSPADRPIMNVLDTGKYTDTTGKIPRSWNEALRECIEDKFSLNNAG